MQLMVIGAHALSVAGVLAVLQASPAVAASQNDWNACRDTENRGAADRNIEACNRILGDPDETAANRVSAYAARCGLWFTKRSYDRGLTDCNQAIELDPNHASAYNDRGNNWRGKSEQDRAIADYDNSIRLNPNRAVVYNNRGLSWRAKGDLDRAISDFSHAIELDPKLVFPLVNRGVALRVKGALDPAIADFDRAISVNPGFASAYIERGSALRDQGLFDRAVADHSRGIELDPGRPDAYRTRGTTWIAKGEADRAMADFNKAIEIDPKYAFAYRSRASAFRQAGDFKSAISDYERVIALAPKNAVFAGREGTWLKRGEYTLLTATYLDRGTAREEIGDIEGARADYNTVLAQPLNKDNDKNAQDAARERLAALSTGAGRRVALVIGNSAYKAAVTLTNPIRDADMLARTLRSIGFQTVLLRNDLGYQALNEALHAFARETENADWALVYFAGHGMQIDGTNYFIPTDAKLATDRDVEFEAIPLDRVLAAVSGARRLRLVLVDACRDNPFAAQMRRSVATRSISRGFARVEPNAGTLVVYAAKDGEVALDGDGGANSPFAAAVAHYLTTPGIEVRRLFDLVRDDVMEATNNRQQPFSYGSISGRQEFYFVAK